VEKVGDVGGVEKGGEDEDVGQGVEGHTRHDLRHLPRCTNLPRSRALPQAGGPRSSGSLFFHTSFHES
jgi:hypothetical protein